MRALHVAIVLTSVMATTRSAHALQIRDLSVYYGTDRATLGVWFGKLAFGQVDAPQLPRAQPGVEVELVKTGRRIDGVVITIPAESCAELESQLPQMWGPPNEDTPDFGSVWSSKSGAQGAKFEGNSGFDLPCRLRFFRRVSPQQWLNASRQSVVPIWAIGKPATELEAAISVLQPEHDADGIHWQDTAIDGTRVTLTASIQRKRVLHVVVGTELGSTKPAWQRVVALFGKPDSARTDEDIVRWRWRHAPGVEVSTFAGTPPAPRVTVDGQLTATTLRTPTEPSSFPASISFGVRARD